MQLKKINFLIKNILGDDLEKGRTKLDNLVKEIETNLVELSKCRENIQAKDSKLSELVTKMELSENQLNIDEYFGPVQPLYKQLFNAFAEENSIVDTIFYLNEALQKDVIDLDIFIKVITFFNILILIINFKFFFQFNFFSFLKACS